MRNAYQTRINIECYARKFFFFLSNRKKVVLQSGVLLFLSPVKNVTLWRRGERSALARKLNISPSYLCDILHGRKHAPPSLAKRIEAATCGRLSRLDVIYPNESLNPLVRR